MKYFICFSICFVFGLRSNAQSNFNGYPSTLHQPPETDFSWVNACFGDTTQFINGSIRANTYKWYIYDKHMNKLDSSTNTNISYLFPSADTFYVYLEASNGHPVSATDMIIIDTATTADFNFMHCSNQFMNHSTCATSFLWDFGDGTNSTSTLPTHQYADTGHYTVKLIAYKGIYSDTMTKQIFVNPTAFPTAIITYHLSHDTLFVHALDSSAGMLYNWKFGDFTPNVYKRDTFHVYANPGTYIMYFSDWNTCSTAYTSDTIVYNSVSSINAYHPNNSSISIFPNPISINSELNLLYDVVLQNNANLKICNVLGEIAFEKNYQFYQGENKLKIPTIGFSEGIYFVTLQIESIKINTKLVVIGN